MRKSLAECKPYVVVAHSAKYVTVMESYNDYQMACKRADNITCAGLCASVFYKDFCVTREQEGKWAWNKSVPY